jgi:hypothetical protein
MNRKEIEVVLWRASALGFSLLLFSFLMMCIFYDCVISMTSYVFPDISRADMASDIYLLYGGLKVLIFALFVLPALALFWDRKARS